MRRGMWHGIWISIALGACDIPPQVQAEMACTTICNCFDGDGVPSETEQCIARCIDESGLGSVPQDCFECIQAHANACSTLVEDCDPLCRSPEPDPGPIMDAGEPR
ncbi:MAG: hypothetical protein H0T89_37065 [Deltaproteobacteria bacterium]|nr:hypothetical protein [Deltaproteobacteria bacterium]MDQ3301391.1 hypothetical protein [Myxococcota bacterium]